MSVGRLFQLFYSFPARFDCIGLAVSCSLFILLLTRCNVFRDNCYGTCSFHIHSVKEKLFFFYVVSCYFLFPLSLPVSQLTRCFVALFIVSFVIYLPQQEPVTCLCWSMYLCVGEIVCVSVSCVRGHHPSISVCSSPAGCTL